MLGQHNLDNKLASDLYELLENKNSDVMLNWNMNIVNSYTISVLERIEKLESFIVSPEINFSKIRELGKTRLKKALLIYSKLKGMTIDIDIADNKNEVITNKENDKFNIIKNEYGTEIFLDKPLNIINIMENIKKLNVDIVVLEFTTETIEDIKKVLKQLKTRKGEYREYNYKQASAIATSLINFLSLERRLLLAISLFYYFILDNSTYDIHYRHYHNYRRQNN